MIKVETLKKLLEVKQTDLQKLNTDQLRLLLGVFRYSVRVFEREINQRCAEFHLGNVPDDFNSKGKIKVI